MKGDALPGRRQTGHRADSKTSLGRLKVSIDPGLHLVRLGDPHMPGVDLGNRIIIQAELGQHTGICHLE